MGELTTQDIKDYLGIDYADAATDRLVEATKAFVGTYMEGALGADYPRSDERVKAVEKILASDFFDHRDLSEKANNATRRLVDSSLQQVRLEMRNSPPPNGGGAS